MQLLDPAALEWWLPAGYILLAALVEVLWKARADQSLNTSKRHDDDDAPDSTGSLRAPLLQESRGEYSSTSCRTTIHPDQAWCGDRVSLCD